MKFNPKKRVGSPASVRGIRGVYLLYMISFIASSLLFFLIISSLAIPFLFKVVLIGLNVVFLIYKYFQYTKFSKGDMQLPIKSSCRISIIIKK